MLQRQGLRLIAGADEVGRGSWAGPLVAAAVVLPLENPGHMAALRDVTDSKELTPDERQELFREIRNRALAIGLGWSSHHLIDRDGLGKANRRALLQAVLRLQPAADALLVDHFRLPECMLPQISVTKGDALSLSIAAASIVAKVVRDRWMQTCERRIPGYGFGAHKGYGTLRHRQALAALGPSRIHRVSFRPIASLDA